MCPSWDNLDQAIIGQVTQRFSHRIVRNAVLPGEVQVTTVADNRICNNVGTVESQSPPPGTALARPDSANRPGAAYCCHSRSACPARLLRSVRLRRRPELWPCAAGSRPGPGDGDRLAVYVQAGDGDGG
jgi:hypothetical protein